MVPIDTIDLMVNETEYIPIPISNQTINPATNKITTLMLAGKRVSD
jgi:hypothetical protein